MPDAPIPFGKEMRSLFGFDEGYTPLNHGSCGAIPREVLKYQRAIQDKIATTPDLMTRYGLPEILIMARKVIAPLLGVPTNEVVFVPNATTGINTVLQNLSYDKKDVIVYFNTIHGACENTIKAICERTPAEKMCIDLQYPMDDIEVVRKFYDAVQQLKNDKKFAKIAVFDTVASFPGVRMPWEALTAICKSLDILSLIDGAHGLGHIDLTSLGVVDPDFFTSNCYKWLYTPRGSAILHVPQRNQHLIRTAMPTSNYFRPLPNPRDVSENSAVDSNEDFLRLFAQAATVDNTAYIAVLPALSFRQKVCGGEAKIREYCQHMAYLGGLRVAKILGTDIMENKSKTLQKCCFVNVRLPLEFGTRITSQNSKGLIDIAEASLLAKWIVNASCLQTYFLTSLHNGSLWVRLSGQIYLGEDDFDWAGHFLKSLCTRIMNGEGRELVVPPSLGTLYHDVLREQRYMES